MAGPIVLHSEMISQFRDPANKKPEAEWMIKGFQLFIFGMFKKILLADMFGPIVDWGFANHAILDSSHVILVTILFTLQFYFDFSGYCDMAEGIDYFGKPLLRRVPKFLRVIFTNIFVCLAFVAFRAESIEAMCNMYKAIFGGNWQRLGTFFQTDEVCLLMRLLDLDQLPGAGYYPMVFYLGLSAYLIFAGKNSVQRVEKGMRGVGNAIAMEILFLYCIVSMSGVSTFLYFNF